MRHRIKPLLPFVLLTLVSGCQLFPRYYDHDMHVKEPATDSAAEPTTTQPSELTANPELPELLNLPASTAPSVSDWMNFQMYAAGLNKTELEKLWAQLQQQQQDYPSARSKLQLAVTALQYPAKRNINQINNWVAEALADLNLDAGSRLFAQWLGPWINQVQKADVELARLHQQLDDEKQSKLELEEKIRKLSDIEQSLNQRQRNREP